MNQSLYALGLKSYVEIRSANKPPTVKVSKRIKEGKVIHYYHEWDPAIFNYRRKKETRLVKTPIKVLDFVGGRFVASIKRTRTLPLKVPVGAVVEIPPKLRAGLLGRYPLSI